LHDLKATSSTVLTPVPKVGRGNGKFDVFSTTELGHSVCGVSQSQIGNAPFFYNVSTAVGIDRKEQSREHIETVVKGNESLSEFWDNVWVAYMNGGVELGKKLPFKYVPLAV
jgi:hypothetical protein